MNRVVLCCLVVSTLVFADNKTSRAWQALARADLTAIQKILSSNHPGPVDTKSATFNNWLEQGYRAALMRTRAISNYSGYFFVIRFFVNGFKDGHLGLKRQLDFKQFYWPGWTLKYVDGQFRVFHGAGPGQSNDVPIHGSRVIDCDGRSVRDLMLERVFPFFDDQNLDSGWREATPLMMIDQQNPWAPRLTSCRIESESGIRDVTLKWKQERREKHWSEVEAASFGPRPKQGLRELGGNWIWIRLPSFDPSREDGEELKSILKKLPKFRRAKVLVFDLRGNSGGNSQWGTDIDRAFFGEPNRASGSTNGVEVDWRVSPGNLKYLKQRLPDLKEKFGANASIFRSFSEAVRVMSDALPRKIAMVREPQTANGAVPVPAATPEISAKVYVLTDGRCASACLDFMDQLLEHPQVVHVGQPTSADSLYMDVREESLPSGLMELVFAMKVYRGRRRGHNQAYQPSHSWPGDISDSIALERWMRTL